MTSEDALIYALSNIISSTVGLDFFSNASSLKQHSADRHVVPLGYIILIPSQPVLALWVFLLNAACCWYSTKQTSSSHWKLTCSCHDIGVKPIIHQSELRTYTKVVLFKENSSFLLCCIVKYTEWNGIIKIDNWS